MLKWFQPPAKRWQQWRPTLQQPSTWHVLDINRHSFRERSHVLHLERHGEKLEIINFFLDEKEIEVMAPANKFIYPAKEMWRESLVTTLENHLGLPLKNLQHTLKQSPPSGGDATKEARGEEWLKTSFLVLERALASLSAEQRLQASIFIGHKDNLPTLRIIVFNLDISFTYHHSSLSVLCFNKRDQLSFDYSKVDFEGVFSALAFPIFDRAIKLTQQISEAILREALREKT